ncbi:PREDICTED: serine/arginine repetitive matrix protein 1-like [Camelina sativa]|uniref:Serine/arginine repetitive matrix protein 1-like n=1 Tax=Camelina sativa TaxID=90675 RepID=A0ABM0SKE9_CAMSA|nr:PREDICTED: serine/arginine repetitive matrix protein 1-like [Camelina sativa]
MSHRYSRVEKEKWPLGANKYVRRPPVNIPESDNSNLLEENALSLVGRVTNPFVQQPRAVIEFLPQLWTLEGKVTGRTEQTITTIGEELGHVSEKDIEEARIRVDINGLKPLEMLMDIRLPTGEITTRKTLIRLEADKRRADNRRSLTFPPSNQTSEGFKGRCPESISRRTPAPLSREQDDNHYSRRPQTSQASLNGSIRSRSNQAREYRHQYEPNRAATPSRNYSRAQSTRREPPQKEWVMKTNSHQIQGSSFREPSPLTLSHRVEGRTQASPGRTNRVSPLDSHRLSGLREPSQPSQHYSATPSPRNTREPLQLPATQVSESANSSSRERRPVLERLSLPAPSVKSRLGTGNSIDSTLLQDVEIRYQNEETHETAIENMSGNRIPTPIDISSGNPASQPQGTSPVQEGRVQTSLRLGPSPPAATNVTGKKPGRKPVVPKAAPKRKVPRVPIKTRGVRSPGQAAKTRKLKTTTTTNPPKKRRCLKKGQASPSISDKTGPSSRPTGAYPAVQLFRSTDTEVVDFQSPPNPLP